MTRSVCDYDSNDCDVRCDSDRDLVCDPARLRLWLCLSETVTVTLTVTLTMTLWVGYDCDCDLVEQRCIKILSCCDQFGNIVIFLKFETERVNCTNTQVARDSGVFSKEPKCCKVQRDVVLSTWYCWQLTRCPQLFFALVRWGLGGFPPRTRARELVHRVCVRVCAWIGSNCYLHPRPRPHERPTNPCPFSGFQDWFARQQLVIIVLFVNISLAIIFYKMLT